MSKDGERAALRRMLGGITASLGDRYTHKTLTETFTVLSMPPTDEGSKRERVERSFAQVPDSDLLQLAERFLQTQDVDAATRIQLQDALWAEAFPAGDTHADPPGDRPSPRPDGLGAAPGPVHEDDPSSP